MAQTFEHKFLPSLSLERVTIDGKRHYVTPSGEKYPSVTTVLSSLSKKGIQEWRERIGEQAANKITTQAAGRGTKLHTIMENYVLNKEDYLKDANPISKMLFRQLKPIVDDSITEVMGVEMFLYSDVLKTAGSCDVFCKYDGYPCITDYKTSSKPKKEEWIKGYFLQSTAYAMMIEEQYNIEVPYIAILIAIEDDLPQKFFKRKDEYVDEVMTIFKSYHLNHSNS